MSSLVEHAEFELRNAGFFDKDSDYDGMLGNAVLELVKVFAAQGHSGMSAQVTLALFEKVAAFRTLGAYKPDIKNARDVSKESCEPPGTAFQCKRDSRVFTFDGGESWGCCETKRVWRKTPIQEFTEQVHAEDTPL